MSDYEKRKRREARRVLQKKLRRTLCEGEAVHHIDGDFTNNNPENLTAMDAREHIEYHRHNHVRPYKKFIEEKSEPLRHLEFITTTDFTERKPREKIEKNRRV